MNHERAMRLVVIADILEGKSFRKIKIKLHRGQLPRATDSIFHPYVDFRSVENRFTFDTIIGNSALIQGSRQRGFGTRPVFIRTKIMCARFVPYRKLDANVLEAEDVKQVKREIYASKYFIPNSFRRTKDMRIVLRETAYPS